MQSLTPALFASWRRRARELLTWLARIRGRDTRRFVVWAEMQPVDFDGDDTSLTEREIQLMR